MAASNSVSYLAVVIKWKTPVSPVKSQCHSAPAHRSVSPTVTLNALQYKVVPSIRLTPHRSNPALYSVPSNWKCCRLAAISAPVTPIGALFSMARKNDNVTIGMPASA